MRRTALLFLSLCLFLLLFGCSGREDPAAEKPVFRAVVTDVTGAAMFVRPVEGSEELRSSDLFSVSLGDISDGTAPQIGDTYQIEYSGEILETYPASLAKIESVVLVSSGSGS